MNAVGFEPTIPASEWPQTHALDHVTTGIGQHNRRCFVRSRYFNLHRPAEKDTNEYIAGYHSGVA